MADPVDRFPRAAGARSQGPEVVVPDRLSGGDAWRARRGHEGASPTPEADTAVGVPADRARPPGGRRLLAPPHADAVLPALAAAAIGVLSAARLALVLAARPLARVAGVGARVGDRGVLRSLARRWFALVALRLARALLRKLFCDGLQPSDRHTSHTEQRSGAANDARSPPHDNQHNDFVVDLATRAGGGRRTEVLGMEDGSLRRRRRCVRRRTAPRSTSAVTTSAQPAALYLGLGCVR